MLAMETKGVATVVVVIIVVATSGGITTPIVVDQVDVNPDSPFYGLERIGESMKETVVGGQGFDVDRVKERTCEYIAMVDLGRAEDFLSLIDEAEDRACAAIDKAGDKMGLEVASEAVLTHLAVLENIIEKLERLEKVPERAIVAISAAIARSSKGVEVIADLRAGAIQFGGARPVLDEIKMWVERLRDAAEENIRKAIPVKTIIQNLELRRAEALVEKLEKLKAVEVPDYEDVVEIAGDRLDSALKRADESGLALAELVVPKHLAVLERLRENVPEKAKIAVSLAICRGVKQAEVIAKVKSGALTLEDLRSEVEVKESEIEALEKQVSEAIQAGIRVAEVVAEIEARIIEGLAETLEELGEKIGENMMIYILEIRVNALTRTLQSSEIRDAEEALKKAIDVSTHAQRVLENLQAIVPPAAAERITIAENIVAMHVEVLRNALESVRAGESLLEALGSYSEMLENYLPPYAKIYEEATKLRWYPVG